MPEMHRGWMRILDMDLSRMYVSKRKIRNYVELVKEGEAGYNILIKPDRSLNAKFTEAYEKQGLETGKKGKKQDDIIKAREYMCKNYYDVRMFRCSYGHR